MAPVFDQLRVADPAVMFDELRLEGVVQGGGARVVKVIEADQRLAPETVLGLQMLCTCHS
jgi:hypothetical protein